VGVLPFREQLKTGNHECLDDVGIFHWKDPAFADYTVDLISKFDVAFSWATRFVSLQSYVF
jgi:hypothetical protein